jgi:hypothetical protein
MAPAKVAAPAPQHCLRGGGVGLGLTQIQSCDTEKQMVNAKLTTGHQADRTHC